MAVIEAIATTYLEADAASVTFSGIPATYEHLQLRISVRSVYGGTGGDYFYVRLNGETSGSNQDQKLIIANTSSISVLSASGHIQVRRIPTAGLPAPRYASVLVECLDYANTNKKPVVSLMSGTSGTDMNRLSFGSGMITNSNAAVDSISFIAANGSMTRGSSFTLYGLNSA